MDLLMDDICGQIASQSQQPYSIGHTPNCHSSESLSRNEWYLPLVGLCRAGGVTGYICGNQYYQECSRADMAALSTLEAMPCGHVPTNYLFYPSSCTSFSELKLDK